MATFEQALDKAFEVAWLRGQDADLIHAKKDSGPEDVLDQIIVAGIEQAFIGALDVLGSLLALSGRIKSFEVAPRVTSDGELVDAAEEWADDSTTVLRALTEWAYETGRMGEAEYAGFKAIYGARPGV